jgi:hypothetical protein
MTQEGDVYRATHATRRRTTLTGRIDDAMRIKAKRAERARSEQIKDSTREFAAYGSYHQRQHDDDDMSERESARAEHRTTVAARNSATEQWSART